MELKTWKFMDEIRTLILLLPAVVFVAAGLLCYKMNEKYSRTLMCVTGILIIVGLVTLMRGHFFFGIIPFIAGVMMLAGIKTPTSKDEKKNIFLLTFFGNPTTSISEGLTMVLNLHWFDIVGVIEIEVVNFEETVDVPQEIRCNDDVTIGGKVTIGFIVDLKSDEERTAGEKVLSYVKAGQKKGVMDIIKGSVIQSLKTIAAGKDSKYMETNPDEVSRDVRKILERGVSRYSDSEDTITLSDLGVDVRKLSGSLVAPQAVRDARNGKAIEKAQQDAQLADTETMNKRVRERMQSMGIVFGTDGKPVGDITTITGKIPFADFFAIVRAQLIEETAISDGKYQVIKNPGGVNVVDADTSGKASKKGGGVV